LYTGRKLKDKTGGVKVSVKMAGSNFKLGGFLRGMASGAVVTGTNLEIEPDFEELDWVHPEDLVPDEDDPNRYGSYLFGNWLRSPYVSEDDELMLIGLGVRMTHSAQKRHPREVRRERPIHGLPLCST